MFWEVPRLLWHAGRALSASPIQETQSLPLISLCKHRVWCSAEFFSCCRKEVDELSRGCSGLLKWHNTLLMFFPLLILALSPFSSFSFLLLLLWMCHIGYCRDSTAELWYSPSAPSLGCVFPCTVMSTQMAFWGGRHRWINSRRQQTA